jgi:hypothetical protein
MANFSDLDIRNRKVNDDKSDNGTYVSTSTNRMAVEKAADSYVEDVIGKVSSRQNSGKFIGNESEEEESEEQEME